MPPEVKFQTKPEMALSLIKQVMDDGVAPAPVLGDEAYGISAEFRRGLRNYSREYFLNAGRDVGSGPASDPAVVDTIHRMLSIMQNKIQPDIP